MCTVTNGLVNENVKTVITKAWRRLGKYEIEKYYERFCQVTHYFPLVLQDEKQELKFVLYARVGCF